MSPRILIIVTSDPRTSARPAEAVRIAAGVGVWGKVEVQMYLRENAILALGETTDHLMDEENFAQYWPVLAETGTKILVQKDAPALAELGQSNVPMAEISDDDLARLCAAQTTVLRF